MSDTITHYKEYLESYAWKALKKMKLEEQPDCEACWEPATTVHHLSYERRGSEKADDIVSICDSCHHECHHVGGYQIKNDEEILRRRFEEVKGEFSEKRNEEIQIDLDSYIKIDSSFSRDKNYIYYRMYVFDEWKKIKWADIITFKVIADRTYAKDKNCFYYCNKKIECVDLDSFMVLSRFYAKDKNNAYCGERKIEWVDLSNFIAINNEYAKDKDNIYIWWKKIEWVDSDGFEILHESLLGDCEYFKDKESVFFNGQKIEWADLVSFIVIDDDFSKDKNHIFQWWRKIEGVDPKTFKVPN